MHIIPISINWLAIYEDEQLKIKGYLLINEVTEIVKKIISLFQPCIFVTKQDDFIILK